MNQGKFITFEGVDGTGKSTHLEWATEFLKAQGKKVVRTREPGGTPLGEKLRAILLSEPMQPKTEALLMFAARAEHLETVILPALAQGTWVISDRFTDASFAYQGGGRGVAVDKLEALERWLQGNLQPDLTLLFDAPLEISRQRLAQTGKAQDRFEQEKADFFDRVRNMYLKRAQDVGQRIQVIDSNQPIADVQKTVADILLQRCLT